MEKKFKRTTVTSALPYANGPVHIGHLAGVYVPADIYVRYLRLKKEDVIFIGGSDEHGVPITIRAKKEGITPQDVVDRYHTLIKKSFEEFGVSFDVYSRTTSKTHHDTASDFFRKLYDKGEFIEKTSMQYYDEEVKTFLADRYITGECPHCHAEGAYGDQCEKCGTSLSPTDLINPKSAISGSKPVMKETKHKDAVYEVLQFLYDDETIQIYLDDQNAVPCKEGDFTLPSMLDGMRSYIDEGRMSDFHDHHYPSEMSVDAMVQTYLMDDSSDSTVKFLKRFDKEWKRYNRDLIAKVQKYEEEKAS